MIEQIDDRDMEQVCRIWLKEMPISHPNIPSRRWRYKLKDFKREVNRPNTIGYVYKIDGMVKASAIMNSTDHYVYEVCVESGSRKQGLARELLTKLAEGQPYLLLHVYGQNRDAVRAYKKIGFREIERMWDFWGQDVRILMRWGRPARN